MRDQRFARAHVRDIAREAAPSMRWSPEALDALERAAVHAVAKTALSAATRTKRAGRVIVNADDVRASKPTEVEAYLAWCESTIHCLMQSALERGESASDLLVLTGQEQPPRPILEEHSIAP